MGSTRWGVPCNMALGMEQLTSRGQRLWCTVQRASGVSGRHDLSTWLSFPPFHGLPEPNCCVTTASALSASVSAAT